MAPPQVNLAILNDNARWADDTECVDLLVVGTWFLHDTLKSRYPKCTLLRRIIQLGNWSERLYTESGADSTKVSGHEAAPFFREMNILGTLGHSLWRLKDHLDSPGLRYELKELSQLGTGENPAGDNLRLRGQGFLLLAAGHLANEGFDLEFIARRDGKPTPDLFATRDGHRFTCEMTNRYPESGDFGSVDFFWSTVQEVVGKKKAQLTGDEFKNGVLIIDCTPVWEAFGLAHVPLGGQLVYSIPEKLGGMRTGSSPLVRYDDSPHSQGLQGLEAAIRGSTIGTVILWNHRFETWDAGYRRRMEYRILGTIHGSAFWSYFPKACVFPGPEVNVVWPTSH